MTPRTQARPPAPPGLPSSTPEPPAATTPSGRSITDEQAPRLVITVGLPGSGKTTLARAWVAASPATRKRVNRDDLTHMLIGGWCFDEEHQAALSALQVAAVRTLLHRGYAVVCDDTNLRPRYRQPLEALAREFGVPFEVWDLTGIPLGECIARDVQRARLGGHHVGEDVIRAMHDELHGIGRDGADQSQDERDTPPGMYDL